MIRNYFISAFRNLIRQKGFSIINISGLAIGMAIAILIFLWVKNELSYDKFNEKSTRIHRLVQTQHYSSGPLTTFSMPGPIAKDIRTDIPEIVNSFMFYSMNATISFEDKLFTEEVQFADPQLFELFTFDFQQGDPAFVFEDMNSIVITDKMAQKLFDNEDPMGQVIKYNNEYSFKVTGVIAETPKNSSLRFDLCVPFEFIEEFGYTIDRYGWNSYYVYCELEEGIELSQVNEKINPYLEEKSREQYQAENADEEYESDIDLFLFPLEKIHLHSVRGNKGDIQYIYLFSAIAIFILIIACINFMNLATARSAKRAREIALRKTVGAERRNLIFQFLSESLMISFLAMIVAILLVITLLPFFNELTSKSLEFNFTNYIMWLLLIGITLIVGLLAGSYPAFYLSAFNPIKTMRNGITKGKGNFYFRRVLVVFQFVLSVGLIISTIVVQRQLGYLQNNRLGMNLDEVTYLSLRGESNEKYEVFKNELLNIPQVQSISRGNSLPFYIGSNTGSLSWEGREGDDDILIGFTFMDEDYLETLEMNLLDGRFFSGEIQSDTAGIVINQTGAKAIGMENPIGKWMSWGDDTRYHIIGLVEDFHHLPMQHEIDPLVILYEPSRCRQMFIKTAGKNDLNEQIGEAWLNVFPNYPYEPKNLKEIYNKAYSDEATLIKIIGYFSVLAILISCLGLFALAAYMAEQRTKEIGIRKVLGATMTGIISLVSKEFLKWVIIANIIAWPITWFALRDWLNGYTYHTKLSPEIFIYALLISLVIALLTVSSQAIKSALKKPINAIKYE